MIRLSLEGSQGRVVQALRRKAPAAVAAVKAQLNYLGLGLQVYIQRQKLSGQVLNTITGKLISSVHYVPAADLGDKIVGAVEAAEGNAWYGVLHEFGGIFDRPPGTVRLRTWTNKNHAAAFGRFASSRHTKVREVAYGKGTITFPERSFMRSSLAENEAEIRLTMKDAIIAALVNS